MNYLEEDKKRLEKANNFKKMYHTIGENISNPENIKRQDYGNWHFDDYAHDKKTNFKAVVLRNDDTKEVAVFNIGTDFKNRKDIMDDIKMGIGRPTRQMEEANKYHKQISNKYKDQGYKMNSIGHSEGGSESQYVGLGNPDTDVYTYNAYGIGRIFPQKNDSNSGSNIYNFRDPQDPVSKLGKNVGNEYIVPINDDTKRKPSIFGYKEAHQIKNMGDINNSVTPAEYKKKKDNLGFIDNMDKVVLTGEDIGAMDGFTFGAYEPLIDKRLKERSILPRAEANYRAANGGGLTFVNGYTRSDGVKVPGHYRTA